MKRLIVKIGLKSKTDNDLLVFAQTIEARMTGNVNYPNATALIADAVTKTNAFLASLTSAATNAVGTVAAKNSARVALEQAMFLLASYVEDHCGNDLAKLQSSGFDARKSPTTHLTITLGSPVDMVLTQQKGGALNLKFKKGENSVALEARTRKATETEWDDSFFCTGTECILAGFTAGEQYEVQTRAIGRSQKKETSETTSWKSEMFWAI
jgi:hypothetical protein